MLALGHVTLTASGPHADLRKNRTLPFFVGALDVRPQRILDVVAAAAKLGAVDSIAIEKSRCSGRMRFIGHRIGKGAAHNAVLRQVERVVVRARNVIDRVTKVTGDALHVFRERVEVQPIGRRSSAHRHRCMAIHAELSEILLPLATTVHGDENGIVRCVGVHASRPLAVMLLVARLARLGIHELLSREPLGLWLWAAAGRAKEQEGHRPLHRKAPAAIHLAIAHCSESE